jgi:hypothetical protein
MISPPSFHTLVRAQAAAHLVIWLGTEATAMRCSSDRLAERVRAVIGREPRYRGERGLHWLNLSNCNSFVLPAQTL